MAKKQPPVLGAETLDEALNPINPTQLTATMSDVTGGPVGAAQVAEGQRIREAPVEAALAEAGDSVQRLFDAATEESYTGYILQAAENARNAAFSSYDPNFDATRHAMDLVSQLGIEASDENLKALGRSGTMDDQLETAKRIQRHEQNQQILARHGGWALASGMLDPTQLLVDFGTFGASRAYRLGRLASGVMGATAGTALTGAADIAGKDTTGLDYVLNAGITGGAMALFGTAAPRGWYGGANVPTPKGSIVKWTNSLLSEFDKLSSASPEASELMKTLMDDPVRRSTLLSNSNAASDLRMFRNEADGLVKEYEDALDAALAPSHGWFSRRFDVTGRFGADRDALQNEVATELLRRNEQWRLYGNVMPDPNVRPEIARLADISDKLHGRLGEMARDSGVRGFEDFTPQPGYFHRSWNDSLIRSMEATHKGAARRLIAESALSGIKGLERDEADALAGALIQRVRDKASHNRTDFMGGLGKADTTYLRESLERAKLNQGVIDSIMAKVEQKASDQGTVKYGKHRLSFDMGTEIRMDDGTLYKMTDLIDTDLDRVIENYTQGITGRSALGRQGIADESDLTAFRKKYADSIAHLPQAEQADLMQQLDGLLGDFTGQRPEANILGQGWQRAKSIADATMLTASGFWQVGEYATMAQRHGVFETGKEFIRQFPGVRTFFKDAAKNPDLADEMSTVLGLDLGRDVRLRPWKRQHDAFLDSQDTAFDRLLHMGKQAVPYLNGMKYVHAQQSRMNANLVLNKFARAAKGDEAALKQIMSYAPDLDWKRAKAAIDQNVTYSSTGRNAASFNWGGWAKGDIDAVMNAALRMMDDSVLFGRVGQGASIGRSAVGQVMFQFKSFVSFAHNKLLRGTLRNEGVGGLATLLAYQYPLTFMLVMANEARKGNADFSEKGMQEVARKAVGYTAGLGFAGDAAGILGLTSDKKGMTVPLLSLAEAPGRLLGGIGSVVGGETRQGAYDIGKAASMVVPFMNILPGTALALDAIKGE